MSDSNYIADWPAAQYHSQHDRISKHGLDQIRKSPATYKYGLEHGNERTPAMRWGSLVHSFILEPEKFDAVVAPDCDRRTKAGKEQWEAFSAENAFREIIKREELEQLEALKKALSASSIASALLAGGLVEPSLIWSHPLLEVQCKARPDLILADKKIVVDLKTCADASVQQFTRDAYKYRYHVQAGFYLDACAAVGVEVDSFVFVCVEKEAPFLVQTFEADGEFIKAGKKEYMEDLLVYKECLEKNEWPGYSDTIKTLSLPSWIK